MAANKNGKGGITKAEAVRRAIGDLGRDAKPSQLQGHIKTKFGIDMTPGHVKVERQKFLKREADKGKPAAATKPPVQASVARKAPAGGMTKQEAVRHALADLGRDAKPAQLHGHIKDKFGIDMTTDHISTAKGIILKQEARQAKPAAQRPTAKPPAQASAASKTKPEKPAPKKAATPQSNGIGLEDIEAAKGLVERVGADSLRKLIDVLAR
jgi:hypothetical protein